MVRATRRMGWMLAVCLAIAGSAWAQRPVFPVAPGMAGAREMPRPAGIGLTFYHQQQDYRLRDGAFEVWMQTAMPGVEVNAFEAAGIDPATLRGLSAENRVTHVHAKADLWVLPFLNVFGLVGYLDGETEARMPAEVAPRIGFDRIEITYDGPVYGVGATLAGGLGNVFATFTAAYTYARPSASDTTIASLILAPRIGLSLPTGTDQPTLVLWTGAMYQEIEERNRGSLSVPGFGALRYEATMEQKEPWNVLLGAGTVIGRRWALELEGGFGSRRQVALNAVYRF